jgi:hypothetical protein
MLKIVHASMIFNYVACLFEEKNAFNIYPCFLENTYSKDCSENRTKLFSLSLSPLVPFSPVYIYGRLSEKNSGSQTAFGTTFTVTGYPKDGSFLQVTGRIFTISK